ncbi:hypothetical protein L598_002900000150 [Mesorhizobium sp. J18]|uniref:hypothetical protein n=1 Tax=Mesorhizobium sp. J18 TaxID=935263 RepID=UPI0011999D9A|nr:hypothetical protein [Mesorhizobium sp. J18]TWG95877.1 hypothetical protein L598_002900000150 [Mesorhizobium sp. J18]
MIVIFRFLAAAILSIGMVAGLAAAQDVPASKVLAEPNVVMEADPPPPFTYWAPENSTIRNHPRMEGVWTAEIEGQPARYYYGDQCRASEFQGFVGQPLDALPEKPENAVWRIACSSCAMTSDLGRARMNVFYEDSSQTITKISCG